MRPVTIKAFVRLSGEERRIGAIWIQDPPADWEGHHLEVRLVNHSIPSRGDAVIITVEEEETMADQWRTATLVARQLIMDGLAAYANAQMEHKSGAFSVRLGGWKDYYFRAPDSAPLPCRRCARSALYRFGDLRRENFEQRQKL